ncbi:MAG: hypothetical protein GDA56_08540 [Hormoscilla sp. GM7CHS1pb]|nr:hypothetical protein [Hormoscilla sp. GM7CHS1pb]
MADRTCPVYGGHHIVIFTDNLWMPYTYLVLANVMRSPKLEICKFMYRCRGTASINYRVIASINIRRGDKIKMSHVW